MTQAASDVRRAERIAGASIAIGCLVLALKSAAWWITGSAALYSDALESTVNVAAAIMALAALHMAAKPADANHPYGHEKAEFFAAVVEGALIVAAALLIVQHAWATYLASRVLQAPWQGIALNATASGINLFWGLVLTRQGRRLRSAALAADGRHIIADVVTSAGIAVGLVLSVATGVLLLDPALAAVTALYVLWSGMRVIRGSVGGLMDEAPAPDVVERFRALVGQHADGALEAHDLRTRHAGRQTFLEFHLVVPGSMTVAAAHDICDRIEAALKRETEGLVITIHVEPEGKAKHQGVLVL
jgi:cation diffusion facilitator family transporter